MPLATWPVLGAALPCSPRTQPPGKDAARASRVQGALASSVWHLGIKYKPGHNSCMSKPTHTKRSSCPGVQACPELLVAVNCLAPWLSCRSEPGGSRDSLLCIYAAPAPAPAPTDLGQGPPSHLGRALAPLARGHAPTQHCIGPGGQHPGCQVPSPPRLPLLTAALVVGQLCRRLAPSLLASL